MDSLYLPLLIAAAVAFLIWAICSAVSSALNSDKRKLAERLGNEGAKTGGSAISAQIVRQQNEATGASGMLTRFTLLENLHRRVIQAYPDGTLVKFLSVVFGIAVVMFFIGLAAMGSMLIGLVAGGIGAYIPFMVLASKRSRRQRLLASQLPEALDFLSRVLRAGHSFSTGVQMMAEELPQPLAAEFRRAYDQHSLGQSLDDALKEMALRIESTDFAFFVTAVLIQRQTGGDLSEVLKNISGMIRQRLRLQSHVKAKTAEGRFTGYILVAFPAVMFVICYTMNPAYAGVLLHTSQGQMMLGTAFGLQMLGLYAIRKITTVEV
jgi:tight adherence protein B